MVCRECFLCLCEDEAILGNMQSIFSMSACKLVNIDQFACITM
jgi:hypothetical protein